MTREEAIIKVLSKQKSAKQYNDLSVILGNEALDVIDEIYNHFEAELEELQNRSCENCKHGTFGIDSLGVEIECKLLWRCSRGYSDKYERKEDDTTE